ncbi:hypothetical protein [Faecalimonas sp.]
MGYGRTRKQVKLDTEKEFDKIIKRGPSESTKRQMQNKAYSTYKKKEVANYDSAADFYEERLKKHGGGTIGQVGVN